MVFVQGGYINNDRNYIEEKKGGIFNLTTVKVQKTETQRVAISDFSIGKYLITQAQWQAIMGINPSHFKGESLPVESVSWEDCEIFIKKLNTKTKKKYRLPSYVEWMFAAKGGNTTKGYKYSGSDNFDEVAWCYENADQRTHPIGQKKANELGLYDMSGNVSEWFNDGKVIDIYSNDFNATDVSQTSIYLLRKGNWGSSEMYCELSPFNNEFKRFSYRDRHVGLRLASSI